MEKGNLQVLLDRIYSLIKQYPPYVHDTYNVFKVLDSAEKETMMCRFLGDLLSPLGEHGKGELFLKSFIQCVLNQIWSDDLLKNTTVQCEHVIDERRRIDIVIYNEEHFIPIEVKIYAEEQKNQCYDYYDYALKHDTNTTLIYLTRFGNAPSEYSLKNLSVDKIKCISWSKDITEWLENMLEELSGSVKVAIEQFIDAIQSMANRRENDLMYNTKEILLQSTENLAAGIKIEKAINEAKTQVMKDMFKEFEKQLSENGILTKYNLEQKNDADYRSYKKHVADYYGNGKNKQNPGITYVLNNAKLSPGKMHLGFRIEVAWRLFAGFCLINDETKEIILDMSACVRENTNLKSSVESCFIKKEVLDYNKDWWIYWRYSNGKTEKREYADVPNFKEFNHCAEQLVNEDFRKKFISDTINIFEENLLKKLKI